MKRIATTVLLLSILGSCAPQVKNYYKFNVRRIQPTSIDSGSEPVKTLRAVSLVDTSYMLNYDKTQLERFTAENELELEYFEDSIVIEKFDKTPIPSGSYTRIKNKLRSQTYTGKQNLIYIIEPIKSYYHFNVKKIQSSDSDSDSQLVKTLRAVSLVDSSNLLDYDKIQLEQFATENELHLEYFKDSIVIEKFEKGSLTPGSYIKMKNKIRSQTYTDMQGYINKRAIIEKPGSFDSDYSSFNIETVNPSNSDSDFVKKLRGVLFVDSSNLVDNDQYRLEQFASENDMQLDYYDDRIVIEKVYQAHNYSTASFNSLRYELRDEKFLEKSSSDERNDSRIIKYEKDGPGAAAGVGIGVGIGLSAFVLVPLLVVVIGFGIYYLLALITGG